MSRHVLRMSMITQSNDATRPFPTASTRRLRDLKSAASCSLEHENPHQRLAFRTLSSLDIAEARRR